MPANKMPANNRPGARPARGLAPAFNLEQFKYEVANELGINPDLRKNAPTIRNFEQQTHSTKQGGGQGGSPSGPGSNAP